MAITNKEQGVWGLDQVYNKINQGSIWEYTTNLSQLMAWGEASTVKNFGLNNLISLSSPTQIPGTWHTEGLFPATSTESPYLGGGVKTDGTLWLWGRNDEGPLGQNNNVHYSSPVQIPGTDWATGDGKRAFGRESVYALKTDGTLWSWGRADGGALGLNQPSNSHKSSPVQLTSATNWVQISGGQMKGGAINTSGELYLWGADGYWGGRGNNTAGPSAMCSSPTQLPGTTWKVIQCKADGYIATKTDGTLWVWGYNGVGALGQNTVVGYSSPIQIPGTTWGQTTATVGMGRESVNIIKTDGTLWMWGKNSFGQLGLNDIANRSSPVQIGTDTTWRSTCNNQYSTFATKTDGSLWAWGQNTNGYLGLDDTIRRSSPVQVPGDWRSMLGTCCGNPMLFQLQ